MVHTFDCLGHSFTLDVESGSVYIVDPLTRALIENDNSPVDISKGEFSRYSASEIAEAREEIEALKEEGVLFSPEPEHKKPAYAGIIKAMCLNISHMCNLRCEYCFADGGSYNGAMVNMSFEVAKKAVDFLIEKSGHRRNLEVDFFGGEPLLNFDVVKKTVAYARGLEKETGKNFRFTITTNATLLNDDAIDFFNREMYNVVISIDGRKDVHNSVRKTATGEGSYDLAMKNALDFKAKRKGQYYVRGTYTALNKDFSEDVLFLNDLGFDQISIEPVVLPETHRLALKKSDIPELIAEYDKLVNEYYERRKTDKWFNFFHFMLDIYHGPCETKRLVGCGAGNEYVAIAPSGDIYPCHQFDGNRAYKLGNVLEGTFDTTIPEEFAVNNLLCKPDCRECWAKYYCSGGCAANAIHYCGDINKPYKMTCELMRKRIECAIAVNSLEKSK